MKSSTKEELIKIINENPELPVVFYTDGEGAGEYTWNFRTNFMVDIQMVYELEERIESDEISVRKYLEDFYADNEEYKDLTNKEYEKIIDQKFKEVKQYKAITIWVY